MNLTIKINTDNDSFADENLGSEISRILKNYANVIESVIDDDTSWKLETILRDINGAKVGQVTFTTDLEDEDFEEDNYMKMEKARYGVGKTEKEIKEELEFEEEVSKKMKRIK